MNRCRWHLIAAGHRQLGRIGRGKFHEPGVERRLVNEVMPDQLGEQLIDGAGAEPIDPLNLTPTPKLAKIR